MVGQGGDRPPGRRHPPPPLARSSGRPRSVANRKGVPIPRLAAGEGEQSPGPRRSDPPSPSALTHAWPQQAPVPERGQGEGEQNPERQPGRPLRLSPLGARVRLSGVPAKASALAGNLSRQSQRWSPGRPGPGARTLEGPTLHQGISPCTQRALGE